MPYIKRDNDNNIVAVSEQAMPGFEAVAPGDEELAQFLTTLNPQSALDQTDLGFIRVVEDVIELLIAKQVILFTELPKEAQEKMLLRQRLREGGDQALDLLSDNEF